MLPLFSGVLAALITPIDTVGRIDFKTFDRVLDFVLDRGVDGVVLGGGTAEYVHFTVDERVAITTRAVQRMEGRGKLFTSVSTASITSTLELAKKASDLGSDALLVPMPYFFKYSQEDLASFCEAVCASVSTPCFLYNLPSFTNPIEVATAIRLLQSVPNLVGIKDSSGLRENLKPLAEGRRSQGTSLFVGDDSLLLPALRAGWDGVVSGIACCLPELIVAIYRAERGGNSEGAAELQRVLDEFIEYIGRLPIPWGVRAALAARGIENGPMHIPSSPTRRKEIHELQQWLAEWASLNSLRPEAVWQMIS